MCRDIRNIKLLKVICAAFLCITTAACSFGGKESGKGIDELLNDADQCLNEMNYELSYEKYGEILKLDEKNIDALAGSLYSAEGKGDSDSVRSIYERTLDVFADMSDTEREIKKEQLLKLISKADKIYFDKPEKRVQVYSDVINDYGWNELQFSLNKALYEDAEDKATRGDYEAAIQEYEQILQSGFETAIVEYKRNKCVLAFVDDLIRENDYPEAEKWIDAYKDSSDMNFEEYAEMIEENNERIQYLRKVYDEMEAGDYSAIKKEFTSPELREITVDFMNESLLFDGKMIVNGDYTGKALGIYNCGRFKKFKDYKKMQVMEGEDDWTTYIYYGDYNHGKQEGSGVWLGIPGIYYYEYFEGEWKDGYPNGKGTDVTVDIRDNDGNGNEIHIRTGSYVYGLEKGDFTEECTGGGHSPRKWSWLSSYGGAEELHSNSDSLLNKYVHEKKENGERIYAACDVDGYYWWKIYKPEREQLGAIGFRDFVISEADESGEISLFTVDSADGKKEDELLTIK